MSTPTTVDAAEAARFEKLARLWWEPAGPFWPLHRLNAVRLAYIRDRLAGRFGLNPAAERPLAGLRILDIGCGGGILSEAVAGLGAEVLGVDVVERNIRIAEGHAAGRGLPLRYEVGRAEALAERGDRFDAVLNMEVVEHVADLPLFMASCAALVRPGGVMIVATLNRTPASFLAAILGAEYLLRWLPRGTHQWRKFVRPEEIRELLAQNGMAVADATGVRVNPLTREFRLTGYLGINYMLAAEKPAAERPGTEG
jgi:2-polyprenyl-6-hydroxyphenyl methylase/3-demethylubiquinone-9 3-methyltransferase